LVRQGELELFEQDFLIGFWMGVAAQNQGATVGWAERQVVFQILKGRFDFD